MSDLHFLQQRCLTAINEASSVDALEQVRVRLMGKTGEVIQLLKSLGQLNPEERRLQGEKINELKEAVTEALAARFTLLKEQEMEERLKAEWQDITLSARMQGEGRLHPITQAIEEIVHILGGMGFSLAEGPEIEDDYHNFTALNIPAEHPARQLMDTFYLPGTRDARPLLLRTHTSGVQIRALSSSNPPLRIMAPGRVYRSDYDQTHTPNFHQVEGLVVEKDIHIGHLRGCLIEFCRRFFELDNVSMRFRPNFFPFTEPSAEIDIQYSRQGSKLILGSGEGWLEVLGCGMVHPHVLTNCGVDPHEYRGFAFGIGVERMAMLKYGITDLRAFYEADLRWLRHYGFSLFEAAPPTPRIKK